MTELDRASVSPGEIVAGKYRVERVLGSGGMGVVVAATHLELDQLVALKFILPAALSGKASVERFMREARAAVRLKSEHIARVYDVGRDGENRPFMVLELLDGMDLGRLKKEKGPLPVADAVEYILQACEALVEAHAAGIVHRDLKPQNLFLTRRLNGTPLVKVLDFGIAKAIGPGAAGQMALTDSAAIIGSPLYMAPEQMRSARTAEVRSDIWALGVILFDLLGGQVPFDGETVTEVCIRVVNEEPVELTALRPELDPALVAIIMRCLEKEPDARWHNVSALAAALEPFSQSAKQGGPVRPWRSFEDTIDSGHPNPFAADATGPSTLVTMGAHPSLGDDNPTPAKTKPSAAPVRSRKGGPKEAVVSTHSSWAESTSSPGAVRRPRAHSTGAVLGLVAMAAVAAAVGGLALGRRTSPGLASSDGPPVATAALVSSLALTSAAPTAVLAPMNTAVAETAAVVKAPSGPTPVDRAARLLSAGTAKAIGAPSRAPSVSASVSTPRLGEPRTAADSPSLNGAPSPNGAPILH